MPVPRKPLLEAIVRGSARVNPGRYKDRAVPKLPPLGPPPVWMSDQQQKTWELFRAEILWLTEADRALVEVTTLLRTRAIYEPSPPAQVLSLLRQCLGALGASPADRAKVAISNEPEADPADGHFQH